MSTVTVVSLHCSLCSIKSHSFVKSHTDLEMLAYRGSNLKLVSECDSTKKKRRPETPLRTWTTRQNAGYPTITPCSRENNICSIGQEILRLHWKKAIHYRAPKLPIQYHILCQMSPFHVLIKNFFKNTYNFYPPVYFWNSTASRSIQVSRLNFCVHFTTSSPRHELSISFSLVVSTT